MNVIGLMIGKKNSSGVPGKNISNVLGKKLCEYPLIAAINSKVISKIFVSKNCDTIEKVGINYDCEIIKRPKEHDDPDTLTEDVLTLVEKGNLSAGHARSLIGLQNSSIIAKKIIQKKLSVRQAEALTRQFRDKKFKLVHKKDSNILDLQKTIVEKTGLNVSINNKKNNSGTISFEYKDLDQLDKIINIIKNNY